jgi:hypothetical protein
LEAGHFLRQQSNFYCPRFSRYEVIPLAAKNQNAAFSNVSTFTASKPNTREPVNGMRSRNGNFRSGKNVSQADPPMQNTNPVKYAALAIRPVPIENAFARVFMWDLYFLCVRLSKLGQAAKTFGLGPRLRGDDNDKSATLS